MCLECNVTDDERASRLPLAESKDASSDVEWVPPPNPLLEGAPIQFGGGAAIPYAIPYAIPISSKPAMPTSNAIFNLGHSSDEEGACMQQRF